MRLYLVKNGVPFDVAMAIDNDILLAWHVIFGEFDGSEFDWEKMRWAKK